MARSNQPQLQLAMRKFARHISKYILIVACVGLVFFLWKALPIISGFGAKALCSDIFLSGRPAADVIAQDLQSFPLGVASYSVDMQDSSVVASVFGLARKKAIFRSGLGATLISGMSEADLRAQRMVLAERSPINQDSLAWPDGDRVVDSLPAGLDKRLLDSVVADLFYQGAMHHQPTRALVVLYNGQLVAERYAAGFTKNTEQNGWSMTKSITNALLGILVGQGRLDINTPAPVEAWKNDERRAITIEDLMHMSSGLRWWEFYAAPSDATNMLFKSASMGAFAEGSPLRYAPGDHFTYSSGSANILSAVIRKTVGDQEYYRFPYEQLFYKIGMLHTILEPDAGGTFVGSSYCYATARDWARFGLLYLQDGQWDGERILPPGWVPFTTTAIAARNTGRGGKYGALWWLNAADPGKPLNRVYPHVPEDCFSCQGFDGQFVWVIPSKKLVVVRLALDHNNFLNPDDFLRKIIQSLPQ
jgi:CubicO group peptidase (beta-lactamase class C family)